jgi:uncharacterized damage-inducible protein DinB
VNRKLIEEYARGGEKIDLAIRGLTREDLLWKPPADADAKLGKWSIQEVVIHLLDSDLIGMDRLKRMLAMENPLLVGYDENLFTQKLHPEEQSAEEAVKILDLSFKNFARVLRKLPDSAFTRGGTHNERGPMKAGEYLQYMIAHTDRHLKFIHAKRAAMGKEMW